MKTREPGQVRKEAALSGHLQALREHRTGVAIRWPRPGYRLRRRVHGPLCPSASEGYPAGAWVATGNSARARPLIRHGARTGSARRLLLACGERPWSRSLSWRSRCVRTWPRSRSSPPCCLWSLAVTSVDAPRRRSLAPAQAAPLAAGRTAHTRLDCPCPPVPRSTAATVPRTFADVVGQEHVVRTLQNAVEQGQVHHAYLFVGSRGTGKTSMAKILAACLNCVERTDRRRRAGSATRAWRSRAPPRWT